MRIIRKCKEQTEAKFGVNNSYPVNVILMQPTTSHETFLERSDYVDFESTSKLRNWPICVGEKRFFVDPTIFSRNSDYFRVLMGNTYFVEGADRQLRIQDETAEDVRTLITVISPNSLGMYPDPIDERNVCTVLRLCDKYLMTNLKQNCVDFLREYRPDPHTASEAFHLFYELCFSLDAEYEHDETLADVAFQTMYNCLAELTSPSNIVGFQEYLVELTKERSDEDSGEYVKRIADAVLHGGIIFGHRISFTEEVQGLGCHQCSMRPPTRQSRSKHRRPFCLALCKSCNREVCVQCRRSLCPRLFEDWINELRS